jgi:hypothetical protein
MVDVYKIIDGKFEKIGERDIQGKLILNNQRFNGSDYNPEFDDKRLSGQIKRVFNLMSDGKWRTLNEISEATGDPHASISAQLRHLRKDKFGAHVILKRSRGERVIGLFEYKLQEHKEHI